ncbi:inositol monophosphatase family protein [Mesotoga sp. UBA5847]|uniref:inositol monophosphatase family protein n=1 Tax=Mesotoga sp. UBA5847 TaxID=1946859 RepID=UPI0025D63025|nr:inositol monophosphatase family protein [Mesotoga sp. UBA5847]MDD3460204.1 inositol monophosphatase family protein [Mesotoga sp.]HNS35780.1 inositol monophosphatase family protein [Mesotoga sp.]
MDNLLLNTFSRKIRAYLPELWRKVSKEEFSVERKSGYKDIVTSVDLEIEENLKSFLHNLFPDAAYLGEESGPDVRSSTMWIVDPVDGTTNFSKSNPHYSTQIALYTENRVVLAVTYDHNRKETFHAIEGQGAYLNNKRIWVSKTRELREATSHVGLQYSSETSFERITRRINRAIKICRGVRITGSACLDFAYVAAGRADIFWEEKLKPWDVASGVLLVKEAGGFVGSCLKEPLDLLDPNVLVANNSPELVEEFRERVLYD